MTHKLPPNLLALFSARPVLRYLPPNDHAPEERKTNNIGGIAQFLPALEVYKEEVEYTPTESWLQRKERVKAEKRDRARKALEEGEERKPGNDPNVRGDAFKTLFVARLSYETREGDLEREFGRFGPIERVCLTLLFSPIFSECCKSPRPHVRLEWNYTDYLDFRFASSRIPQRQMEARATRSPRRRKRRRTRDMHSWCTNVRKT